ncbi:MAG: hypothetical protein EP326_05895 [Deltaproteobacteria bacterium]|nr:MAG: hypothetical protein EP326_05895 [Deltaproteobacteria bacterium]TNF27539.1 MAG: hypothetical protein EP319_11475 [Deltaproteobacteria bacterium]
MKLTLILLMTLLSLNSFADSSTSGSSVKIEDSSSTPEPVATPVSVEEESTTTIPTSEDIPSEESTDTSSSDDEGW